MTPPPVPTDAELDTLVRTRLALVGIDLDQLREEPDAETGSPSRAQALASLRDFVAGPLVDGVRTGGLPLALATWTPPAPSPALAQQQAPPAEYPSIQSSWTGLWPVEP